MTLFIWILSGCLQTFVMCKLPAPINVSVSSNHFVHILKWEPGPGTTDDVYPYYKVEVRSIVKGCPWEVVAGCNHVVSPLECNVTKAFATHNQTYYCRVTAMLKDQVSVSTPTAHGFTPIEDTHLDPPLVRVQACGSDLCVGLSSPVEGLLDLYDKLSYDLKVKSSSMDRAEFLEGTKSLQVKTLDKLAPGIQYCVSVRIAKDLERKASAYSPIHCASTTAVLSADAVIPTVLIVSGLLVLGMLVMMERTGFLCLRTRYPGVLNSIEQQHERMSDAVPSTLTLVYPLRIEESSPPPGKNQNNKGIKSEEDPEESEEDPEDTASNGGRAGQYEGKEGGGYESPFSTSSSKSSSSSSRTGLLSHSSTSNILAPPALSILAPPSSNILVPPSPVLTSNLHSNEAQQTASESIKPSNPSIHPSSHFSYPTSPSIQLYQRSSCSQHRHPEMPSIGILEEVRGVIGLLKEERSVPGPLEEDKRGGHQDVNLLSVSLSAHVVKEDNDIRVIDQEPLGPVFPIVQREGEESTESTLPLFPSPTLEPAAIETISTTTTTTDSAVWEEEEEEEEGWEGSGYLSRP